MSGSSSGAERLQWALLQADNFPIPADVAAELSAAPPTLEVPQPNPDDLIRAQRQLLENDDLKVPEHTTQAIYLDIAPMTAGDFEASRPKAPAQIAPAAAKIAVEAIFTPGGVTLRDGARNNLKNNVPYITRIRPHPERANAIAASRRTVSYAVLGEPNHTLSRAKLQAVAGHPTGRAWTLLFGLLENWWQTYLTVDGQPLIIPAHNKPGHGIRVNPQFTITREWRAGQMPKELTR